MKFTKIIKLPKTIYLGIKNKTKQLKVIWIFSSKNRIRKKIFGDIYLKNILNILVIKAKNKAILNTYIKVLKSVIFGSLKDYFLFLEMRGTGFKFELIDNLLLLRLGFSHFIKTQILTGVQLVVLKPNLVLLKSFDFQLLTKVCASIKLYKPLDSYKGKGLCFKGTVKLLKEGKKTQQ